MKRKKVLNGHCLNLTNANSTIQIRPSFYIQKLYWDTNPYHWSESEARLALKRARLFQIKMKSYLLTLIGPAEVSTGSDHLIIRLSIQAQINLQFWKYDPKTFSKIWVFLLYVRWARIERCYIKPVVDFERAHLGKDHKLKNPVKIQPKVHRQLATTSSAQLQNFTSNKSTTQ